MSGLQNFVKVAREFLEWCQSPPEDTDTEARTALRHLVRLYSGAMELQYPHELNDDLDGQESTDEVWHVVFRRAGALPFNYYSLVADPIEVPTETVVTGDLADDVADVHRDLTEGLSLYDGGHMAEAEWTFLFSFQAHWGAHAAHAIGALHSWLERHGGLVAEA